MLIGTAVCGKPHVRWCERVDGVKRPSLYFNYLDSFPHPRIPWEDMRFDYGSYLPWADDIKDRVKEHISNKFAN